MHQLFSANYAHELWFLCSNDSKICLVTISAPVSQPHVPQAQPTNPDFPDFGSVLSWCVPQSFGNLKVLYLEHGGKEQSIGCSPDQFAMVQKGTRVPQNKHGSPVFWGPLGSLEIPKMVKSPSFPGFLAVNFWGWNSALFSQESVWCEAVKPTEIDSQRFSDVEIPGGLPMVWWFFGSSLVLFNDPGDMFVYNFIYIYTHKYSYLYSSYAPCFLHVFPSPQLL